MAKKPVDHDATMDLSMSQLVVDEPAPRPVAAPRPAAGDTNDMSLWAYRVVGSEDFAPVPARPQAPRVRIWLVVLLLLVTLGAGGVVFYRYLP